MSLFSFGKGNLPGKKDESIRNNTTEEEGRLLVSFEKPIMNERALSSRRTMSIRQDSLGYSPEEHHHSYVKIDSLQYLDDESEAYRAFKASGHFHYRGAFWNEGKRKIMVRYMQLVMIGIFQGSIAYFTNVFSQSFIQGKFDAVHDILNEGNWLWGFFSYYSRQLLFAACASCAVMIEPMSGGSGIPEVKCFLNGIDLPRITDIKTGVCKVLGVICSVSAGLPVGKEGPMVHSGSVVATAVTKNSVRDDRERRDFVACGAASGVCTAFSAPIGGILFALEEGASYWSSSATFRTFFCSMCSLATLYTWNSLGAHYGKIGFDKLFSFGNFIFEGMESSYSVWELLLFVFIGCMGGLIGAIFNSTNEKITKWRMKYVNHSKSRRFLEVLFISSLVSIISFGVPFVFHQCLELPSSDDMTEKQADLLNRFVEFGCPEGSYNPLASLFFTDGNDAIRLLFHMHQHTFPMTSLFIFFLFYISLATITYGIAVPSGLFVPSLLSGAAFGRLLGNLIYKISPQNVAFSNTYSLIGAAAVLGGMARMTISLTVILLEATGNEQFALPLMISLFCARIVGSLFNADLYHIHIHMKPGVHFLEPELRAISAHHDLYAGHIMSKDVVFVRPIEKVGTVYDLLRTCGHSSFPVVDTNDKDILYGTINRNILITLLQKRSYGLPADTAVPLNKNIVKNYVTLEPNANYVPLVPYQTLQREHPGFSKIEDIGLNEYDRDCFIDMRPYCNTAPHTVQETTSVNRAYEIFRTLGLRMLVVVNRYNQCVGTITRDDLTVETLAKHMITKGKIL